MDPVKGEHSDSDISDDWNVVEVKETFICSDSESIEVLGEDVDSTVDVETITDDDDTISLAHKLRSERKQHNRITEISSEENASYASELDVPSSVLQPVDRNLTLRQAGRQTSTMVFLSNQLFAFIMLLLAVALSYPGGPFSKIINSDFDSFNGEDYSSVTDNQEHSNVGKCSARLLSYEKKMEYIRLAASSLEDGSISLPVFMDFIKDIDRPSSARQDNNNELLEFTKQKKRQEQNTKEKSDSPTNDPSNNFDNRYHNGDFDIIRELSTVLEKSNRPDHQSVAASFRSISSSFSLFSEKIKILNSYPLTSSTSDKSFNNFEWKRLEYNKRSLRMLKKIDEDLTRGLGQLATKHLKSLENFEENFEKFLFSRRDIGEFYLKESLKLKYENMLNRRADGNKYDENCRKNKEGKLGGCEKKKEYKNYDSKSSDYHLSEEYKRDGDTAGKVDYHVNVQKSDNFDKESKNFNKIHKRRASKLQNNVEAENNYRRANERKFSKGEKNLKIDDAKKSKISGAGFKESKNKKEYPREENNVDEKHFKKYSEKNNASRDKESLRNSINEEKLKTKTLDNRKVKEESNLKIKKNFVQMRFENYDLDINGNDQNVLNSNSGLDKEALDQPNLPLNLENIVRVNVELNQDVLDKQNDNELNDLKDNSQSFTQTFHPELSDSLKYDDSAEKRFTLVGENGEILGHNGESRDFAKYLTNEFLKHEISAVLRDNKGKTTDFNHNEEVSFFENGKKLQVSSENSKTHRSISKHELCENGGKLECFGEEIGGNSAVSGNNGGNSDGSEEFGGNNGVLKTIGGSSDVSEAFGGNNFVSEEIGGNYDISEEMRHSQEEYSGEIESSLRDSSESFQATGFASTVPTADTFNNENMIISSYNIDDSNVNEPFLLNSRSKHDKFTKKDFAKLKKRILEATRQNVEELFDDFVNSFKNGNDVWDENGMGDRVRNLTSKTGDWFHLLGDWRSETRRLNARSDWLFDRAVNRRNLNRAGEPASRKASSRGTQWLFLRALERQKCREAPHLPSCHNSRRPHFDSRHTVRSNRFSPNR